MKGPIAAFFLSLGLSLTLNLNHVTSSEIELDQSKPHALPNSFSPPDEYTYHKIKSSRARRMAEQRERVRAKIASGEFHEKYHRITDEQLTTLVNRAYEDDPELTKVENQWIRRGNLKESLNDPRRRDLWGSWSGVSRDPYEIPSGMADTSADWEKWAQGYRHIGDFVDCSNMFNGGGGSHDSGDGGANCHRWSAWCAYVDPYYAGGGYDEYFGNNAAGKLDCHKPGTSWLLLGCYAQELYQFYEQISKHLWAIDDYNYVVALAGLAYMTDANCLGPYYDNSNSAVYFGVMPLEAGKMMMGAYSDDQCIYPNEKTSATYDDFFQSGGLDLGSKDQGQDDGTVNQLMTYWQNAQEYTMTLFNEVYNDYLYCTSCMDYPTYQDGYFIGDSGTDDDDLINQCWKFYSHDSFNLPVDGMAQAAMQGGLTMVTYGGATFGQAFDGMYSDGQVSKSSASKASEYQSQRVERLKANLYLTAAGIVFVATFLAFAVARGSSKKKKSSSRSRSRRLLDADYGGSSDRRRSSSRAKSSRSASRSSSKSRTTPTSSRSKSRTRDGDYKAPSDRPRSKSRPRSSTRK